MTWGRRNCSHLAPDKDSLSEKNSNSTEAKPRTDEGGTRDWEISLALLHEDSSDLSVDFSGMCLCCTNKNPLIEVPSWFQSDNHGFVPLGTRRLLRQGWFCIIFITRLQSQSIIWLFHVADAGEGVLIMLPVKLSGTSSCFVPSPNHRDVEQSQEEVNQLLLQNFGKVQEPEAPRPKYKRSWK